MDIYKPNVVLPLASSYNERGVNGFTTSFTNNLDQRKVNSWYEIASNSITGKRTVYLTKRPGCPDSGLTYGTATTDVPYLISDNPSLSVGNPFVIHRSGTSLIASNGAISGTIFTDASNTWYPSYSDTTIISSVPQLVVQFRTTTSPNQRVFYANAVNSWTEITDNVIDNQANVGKMEHLDGFAFILYGIEPFIYNSSINSLSGWSLNNYIAKSVTYDKPAGLAKCGQILLAFGDETVEGFVNAGNPSGSPLRRVPELMSDVGLGATSGNGTAGGAGGSCVDKRHYYVEMGKKIYFVGRRTSAQYGQSLFEFNGSQYNRVSNDFIDKIISAGTPITVGSCNVAGKMAVAIGFDGPSVATQRWLMFFPDWNDWFEWNSSYIQPVNNGEYYLGITDVSARKISSFTSSSAYVDGVSSAYTMTHQFKLPQNGSSRNKMHMCGVVGDTARSASTLGVSFSDDDDQTFSAARNIDMTKNIKAITRCGNFRNRTVRLTHTGNVECRLMNFIAKT